MLLLVQSLIFVNLLLSIKGKPANSRVIFFFCTALIFSLYLALQKPGISADYFNYLDVFERWNVNFRDYYVLKGEWIFVFIVDFARSVDIFQIIYIIYGVLYAVFLFVSLYIVRHQLSIYSFYALAFGFLGLSANSLSGIRYILVTYICFLIFTLIFSSLKHEDSALNVKFTLKVLILFVFAQASHQTGIFIIIFLCSILILSKWRVPIARANFPFPYLFWFLILAISSLFFMQGIFVFIVNLFKLPFSAYSMLLGQSDITNATFLNILSRALWLCLVLYLFAKLPRRLTRAERFCYYGLAFTTLFYTFSIAYEPIFRISNMLVLVAAFSLLYLSRLLRHRILINQSVMLVSTTALVFRVIKGGGEYGYTFIGF